MASRSLDDAQLNELLYQALETELGGVQIYETALRCVQNEDLRKEWTEYLEQTRNHVRVVQTTLEELGLDPETATPGRRVVGHIGQSLVQAMDMALQAGPPSAAELVAAECVVLAETKDHTNWTLIGHAAERLSGQKATALRRAYEAVHGDEDHHLYHTMGWCRELWIDSLGFPAVLPPPEEVKQVETAIGASRAEQARDSMLRGGKRKSSS
jgi:rubrerythrin